MAKIDPDVLIMNSIKSYFVFNQDARPIFDDFYDKVAEICREDENANSALSGVSKQWTPEEAMALLSNVILFHNLNIVLLREDYWSYKSENAPIVDAINITLSRLIEFEKLRLKNDAKNTL